MAKPMTKTQLVAALADEMGTDKKSAGAALDAITGIITKEVSQGGAVTLPGVGKIYCRERPERMVRNPATGEQIKKDLAKFYPGDVLVWHANLLHGGGPILREGATRRSMVAHYFCEEVICYHEMTQRPALLEPRG